MNTINCVINRDSCRANTTDWNDVWKYLSDRSRDQQSKENVLDYELKEHALDYLKNAPKQRTEQILQSLPPSYGFRVLDIGAGPGRIAIPLSGRVARITAVEPGTGMLEVLQEQIAEHDVHNITTVPKRWEDVDIARDLDGPYDLVIASHSLEMPDIRDAIRKMCYASQKWVYIFWSAGISGKEQMLIDLWPALHGREYHTGPGANILYHLLYDMGIFPNVRMDYLDSIDMYPDMEAAVQKFRKKFDISTPEQEWIMRNYLKATLETSENEYFHHKREYRVTFWWDVSEIDSWVKK
jgi:SAM-dependent methyltransferase